jgi:ankyrin repeat protein
MGFGRYDEVDVNEIVDLIKRCVELGCDLEQPSDYLGWTPLHYALTEWNSVVTEALLKAGANPNARTAVYSRACFAGDTCLHIATMTPELFSLLLDYGADPTKKDAAGKTVAEVLKESYIPVYGGDYMEKLAKCLQILKSRTLNQS